MPESYDGLKTNFNFAVEQLTGLVSRFQLETATRAARSKASPKRAAPVPSVAGAARG
jgi:hypothetical protein